MYFPRYAASDVGVPFELIQRNSRDGTVNDDALAGWWGSGNAGATCSKDKSCAQEDH